MQTTGEDLREFRRAGYESPRPDVQELVPARARRILDLGCSSGGVGAALKERQGAEVVGIELDPVYGQAASERLDTVLVGDLEELAGSHELRRLGRFDCVVAADVLEHLRDPWSVLAAAVELLDDGGTAVISVPNVRHWVTFWQLGRRGIWPRWDAGLFDRSHLRWFALWDARRLMEDAGLRVTRVSPVYRLNPSRWQSERHGRLFARTPLAPFFVFQYVLAGVKEPVPSRAADRPGP